MQVKITDNCPRCGRKSEKQVSLEEAVEYDVKRKSREKASADAIAAVKAALNGESPALVIALRAEGADAHAVATLDNICRGARGCEAKVMKLVQEIFQPTSTPPKRAKNASTYADDAGSTDTDTAAEGSEYAEYNSATIE